MTCSTVQSPSLKGHAELVVLVVCVTAEGDEYHSSGEEVVFQSGVAVFTFLYCFPEGNGTNSPWPGWWGLQRYILTWPACTVAVLACCPGRTRSQTDLGSSNK